MQKKGVCARAYETERKSIGRTAENEEEGLETLYDKCIAPNRLDANGNNGMRRYEW